MNPEVVCGSAMQWPAEDVRCVKRAGHDGSHLGWDRLQTRQWADRPSFGESEQPVVVALTGDTVETESWGGREFKLSIVNDDTRITVAMDKGYWSVRVNGATDVEING